jgi:hypothetical protein
MQMLTKHGQDLASFGQKVATTSANTPAPDIFDAVESFEGAAFGDPVIQASVDQLLPIRVEWRFRLVSFAGQVWVSYADVNPMMLGTAGVAFMESPVIPAESAFGQ